MNPPDTDDLHYAMVYAYKNNSNMFECIKFIRKHYPSFYLLDDIELEKIWESIDAYVDVHLVDAETLEAENNKLKENIQYLNDELTEAYNQLAEKHDDIREERDRLKLAVNRIHKHLEGIAEYQCSDDMWSIFLAIDEEVEDFLNESSAT